MLKFVLFRVKTAHLNRHTTNYLHKIVIEGTILVFSNKVILIFRFSYNEFEFPEISFIIKASYRLNLTGFSKLLLLCIELDTCNTSPVRQKYSALPNSLMFLWRFFSQAVAIVIAVTRHFELYDGEKL